MKKSILAAFIMIASCVLVANAGFTTYVTPCGHIVSTIDKETFDEFVGYPGYSYSDYQTELDEEYCGGEVTFPVIDDEKPFNPNPLP